MDEGKTDEKGKIVNEKQLIKDQCYRQYSTWKSQACQDSHALGLGPLLALLAVNLLIHHPLCTLSSEP